MNIVVYPNAKINIGLRILEKRLDGFHNIETLFFPYNQLCDILEIVVDKKLSITNYGIPYLNRDNNIENDLCIKAYRLIQKDYDIPSVAIHLYKAIPVGAGLGGGSSDAAFTLKALNSMFNLTIPSQKLLEYAAILGSDVPFFLFNRPMVGKGRGDILSPFESASLGQLYGNKVLYTLKISSPNISVSTAEAYSSVTPYHSHISIEEVLTKPLNEWKKYLVNDFEKPIFQKHPILKQEKEKMYSEGAVYASMSGSGSSIYGIFKIQSK